jgi:peptidyl-prolyl cis-trans isomerase SurA
VILALVATAGAPAIAQDKSAFPSFGSISVRPDGVAVKPPAPGAPPPSGAPAAPGTAATPAAAPPPTAPPPVQPKAAAFPPAATPPTVTASPRATPVPPVTLQVPKAAPAPAAEPGKGTAAAKAPAATPPKPKAAPVKTAARTDDAAVERSSQTRGVGIAVLVNDDPITGYEIEQRQRFMGLSANIGDRAQANFKRLLQDPATSERLKAILGEVIKANQGKTKEQIIAIFEQRKKDFAQSLQKQAVASARAGVLPTLRKGALDELIDERLKLQEAKRLNVAVSDEDVSRVVRSIAERNKMTETQFAQHLAGMGTDIEAMRARFRATLSWNEVIKRKYGHQIAISERDVERMVAQGPDGDDQVDLKVQRIVLPIAGRLAQGAVDKRVAEAELLRARFKGCASTSDLAGSIPNAKFEDLGQRKAGSIAEPTRSFLLNAKDGEMVPPTVGTAGVELWAVCGREVVKADQQKRTAAVEELRQQEFELFAKRHLRILRDEASIAYR